MTMVFLLRGVGILMLVTVLVVHVPPSLAALGAMGAVGLGGLFVDHRKLLAVALSLTMATLLLEGAVRLTPGVVTPYFRPHERLALEQTYRAKQVVDMEVPHGDLLAIDPSLPKELAEPRREYFASDANGYRNPADYAGQKLVLVGDSFLVGTSTYLSERLAVSRQQNAYNVSFSGSGPMMYAQKVAWVRQTLAPDSCVVEFLFEGNDFQLTDASDVTARAVVPGGLQDVARGFFRTVRGSSAWSRVFYGLTSRAAANVQRLATHETRRPEVTLVRRVGGRNMAFLKGYADVVRRTSFSDHGYVAGRLAAERPDFLVFIPDKFRVYAPLLDEGASRTLPSAQWDYLQTAAAAIGVESLDLTPSLVAHSRQLLAKGETTFWRDDTHWNRHGEDVAAGELVEALRRSRVAACRASVR
jgi:hypothetical protein